MAIINVKEMKEIIEGLFKATSTTLLQRGDTKCCNYAITVYRNSIIMHLNTLIEISKIKNAGMEEATEDVRKDY